MRSKDTLALYERALTQLEKQLEQAQQSLLQERASRFSEISELKAHIKGLEDQFARSLDRNNQLVAGIGSHSAERHRDLKDYIGNITAVLDEKLDLLQGQSAIPTRDIPTVEEMLEDAKNNPTTRKAIEATLQALEFEDPLVGFN